MNGVKPKYSDVQYFLSYVDGKNNVFFLSPNKSHSGWKQLFSKNQERIFNLVFKFYLLSQGLSVETMNGFEELLLLHSRSLSKSENALIVWGQNLLIKYNNYNVLTLTLSRKRRLLLPNDEYITTDSNDLGELLVYKNKNYYFERDLDARCKNSIHFMQFPKDQEDFDKFKKTQIYHYQNLMTKLEDFLSECGINFNLLHFQADHYLENPFIKNIESVESLEIINNTGIDLTESDQQFLKNFLKHQGVYLVTFYNLGKTVSTYEQNYVPPAKSLDSTLKKGFRVYHLIGKTYSQTQIQTSELIEHPITALHFSTLTQNVLKISDNSQSSLLQKVAKVLIEN
ncbi:MAG: hypothetical protein V7K89_32355 [Nostoc sp.]|uniref:hypothetical protein n=1 Tax=Nostoc sp. TaxID=1180 RepID=UPI002FF8529B